MGNNINIPNIWEIGDSSFAFTFSPSLDKNFVLDAKIIYTDNKTNNCNIVWEKPFEIQKYPLEINIWVRNQNLMIKGDLIVKEDVSNGNKHLIVFTNNLQYGVGGIKNSFAGTLYIQNLKGSVVSPSSSPIINNDGSLTEPKYLPQSVPTIIADKYQDLFPYTYMRNWITLEKEEKEFNFIIYPYANSNNVINSNNNKNNVINTVPNTIKTENSTTIENPEKNAVENNANSETSEKLAVENNASSEILEKSAVENNADSETLEKLAVENNSSSETLEKPAVENNSSSEIPEKPAVKNNSGSETSEKPAVKNNSSSETLEKSAEKNNAGSETLEKSAEKNTINPPQNNADDTKNNLYEKLVNAKSKKELEDIAKNFIESKNISENEKFISGLSCLVNPILHFGEVMINCKNNDDSTSFIANICSASNIELTDLLAYINIAEYKITLQNIWFSYFALVIRTGYKSKWLAYLNETLIAANLLSKLFPQGATVPVVYTNKQMKELSNATIILPNDIFNFQRFQSNVSASNTFDNVPFIKINNQNWVMPYAIGDLQLVKQKLLKYEAGEISSIINIMAGEKKKLLKKSLNETTQKDIRMQNNLHSEQNESAQHNVEKEILKTLKDWVEEYNYGSQNNGVQTTYAPPNNINISGSYIHTKGTKDTPISNEISFFAKKILENTSRRISEKVSQVRFNNVRAEIIEQEESIFDNSKGNEVMTGVYRWLNKVYEAKVVNIGNRLILTFGLSQPAQDYIIQSFNLVGENLIEPQPLEMQTPKIESFKDVTIENYIKMCALYNVTDVTIPPNEEIVITDMIEGISNASKMVTIPDGYYAKEAELSYVLSENNVVLNGLIGQNTLSSTTLKPSANVISLNKERYSIPFSASISVAPPTNASASNENTPSTDNNNGIITNILGYFMISLQLTCVYCGNRFETWQADTYKKLKEGYEKQKQLYYSKFYSNINRINVENPLKNRAIIREELRKKCLSTLISIAKENFKAEKSCTQEEEIIHQISLTNYLQFLNQAFCWEEMTYSFVENDSYNDSKLENNRVFAGNENFFTAFLQASSANVFVPVKENYSHKLLFFLIMGMIWEGNEHDVPVLESQLSLVNELKKLIDQPYQNEKVIDKWEVVIPTSLQMLYKDINVCE